jgi:NAD dependent epimerase/dehydratase family enzyme
MANEALLASARVVPAKLGDASFQFIHPTVDRALAAALAPRR